MEKSIATKHIINSQKLLCLFLLATLIAIQACNQKKPVLFKLLQPSATGIEFNNQIVENDSINPIDLDFLYNGGGVAAADFNNDGLTDLYFTASTTSNKLYLNQGNFKFIDITESAGVDGQGSWSNGASVADVNSDGWLDIYVCTTIRKNAQERKNLLYINQGPDKNNRPVFRELAEEYNLADTGHSVQSAFFDFDNDGDLDVYVATTKIVGRSAPQFSSNNLQDSSDAFVDRLYRNDYNQELKHAYFTDVSKKAGITEGGFALGLAIADINGDGWKDIYVTNDFFTNDLLYINNKKGGFTNKAKQYFRHTSQNAMGNDIADINNDGLPDIVAVDMNPEDNLRKKKNMGGTNYYVYQNMLHGSYNLQYVRNTFQLNQGKVKVNADSTSEAVFSDVGFYSGIAETDWSWNVSLADFDNDGLRDILITNGYPRDVTDHDFGSFRMNSGEIATKEELIDQIPQIKVANYAYRNTGTLKFDNVTAAWGMDQPSFSNGAIYADLDNDGDLDYVVNNINDVAFVYENTLNGKGKTAGNFIKIRYEGSDYNINGIGANTTIYYGNKHQVHENSPYRGYLSCVEPYSYFGLDSVGKVDSIVTVWNSGKRTILRDVAVNQAVVVSEKRALEHRDFLEPDNTIFDNVTGAVGINYQHAEFDHIDFDYERLLPHKLSQYGPALASGDIDGNGYDDVMIGGNTSVNPVILLQQSNGKFVSKPFPLPSGKDVRKPENMGILLFDADRDGDPDLYMTSGSNEFLANTINYQDRLYENDGKGNFTWVEAAVPQNFTSKSCVKAMDFDRDGDLDLFVGGRVLPGSYPKAVSSILLRNDSGSGELQFTDVTSEAAKDLLNVGLVCDAIWSDYNNDGWFDLILSGEWMPLTFLENRNGVLIKQEKTGIENMSGWWNSIAAGDFDNDGDMDYIAGNLGENSFYRGTPDRPVKIYAKDFDNNKGYDAITTLFLKDEKGTYKEYTAHTRDDVTAQLPFMKKKFLTYKEFGKADFAQMFSNEQLKDAVVLKATNFKTSLIRNNGQGRFELMALPEEAQLAPIFGIHLEDLNQDNYLDVVLVGNDFGTEVSTGRYDAFNGLVLLGHADKTLKPVALRQSGFYVPGDAKALISLRYKDNDQLLLASQNNGPLKAFRRSGNLQFIDLNYDDVSAMVEFHNGTKRLQHFTYGSSFLSQSSRSFPVDSTRIRSVNIFNSKGQGRVIRMK